ncbi:MAG: hypothetical protein IJH75_03555 [Mogibacterium sp.]|nr:hypothetical protein [Mogibacterium sp.]
MASGSGKNKGRNKAQQAKGFATDRRKVNRTARIMAFVLIAAMILYFVIASSVFLFN